VEQGVDIVVIIKHVRAIANFARTSNLDLSFDIPILPRFGCIWGQANVASDVIGHICRRQRDIIPVEFARHQGPHNSPKSVLTNNFIQTLG
jgi:hypothetical protein